MFSTHLRQHAIWKQCLPSLRSSTDPKFQERPLEGHDISISFNNNNNNNNNSSSSSSSSNTQQQQQQQKQRTMRFLLLTPSDVHSTTPGIMPTPLQAKLHRLVSLTGGVDVAIILLLSATTASEEEDHHNHSTTGGLHILTTLQTHLLSPLLPLPLPLPIPILPLHHPTALLSTLRTYYLSVSSSPTSNKKQPHHAQHQQQQQQQQQSSLTLLTHGTTSARGTLSETTRNILTDLYPDFRSLLGALETREGREEVREWVGCGGDGGDGREQRDVRTGDRGADGNVEEDNRGKEEEKDDDEVGEMVGFWRGR
ncbi:MAG: hypothetical protein M1816_003198 [Peltula sp. TS41687]|nr:MAG: hypothetical protein M1816_003198 [Peltula sp. TS41687]